MAKTYTHSELLDADVYYDCEGDIWYTTREGVWTYVTERGRVIETYDATELAQFEPFTRAPHSVRGFVLLNVKGY